MNISVVIPALNEASGIAQSIASARAPEVDVIVVDGGSRDDTVERAEASGARTLHSPRGRARQLEAGSRTAQGDVVLFLHADTRLPEGYAEDVRAALADPAVVGGAFGFRFDRGGARLRFVEWGVRLRLALFGLPYGDQALFVRRAVLESIGGVPQAPIMEDLDLVRAIRRCGRFVQLDKPVITSARRYLQRGVLRSWLRNVAAAAGWMLGVDRGRIAAWYRP